MRLTLASRASDLARLQAALVGLALRNRWPGLDVEFRTRTSAGDRDDTTPLAAMPDKGAFTTDLSEMLDQHSADLVVHSWKDLPLDLRPGHVIGGSLPRADQRDVLLVRRDVVERRPETLRVLSSSPRRSWLLSSMLPELLPWRPADIQFAAVRGNVPTRVRKLLAGDGDALVVAKAALDRLLTSEFDEAAAAVRQGIDGCRWMVLPIREVPGAPAQGALAIEILGARADLVARLDPISDPATVRAVERERDVLAAHGGGCHAALGASVLVRDYGEITSVRARTDAGEETTWALGRTTDRREERVGVRDVYPRPEERERATRRSLDVLPPADRRGYWVARADALPERWTIDSDRLIWTAGSRTWRRLAARGIWVHGCADGLGDLELPHIDALAGQSVSWLRLTHVAAADDDSSLATYVVDQPLPDDLPSRREFFWTSGTLCREALERWPMLRERQHHSGPGRTSRDVLAAVGSADRVTVWLDYDQWRQEMWP